MLMEKKNEKIGFGFQSKLYHESSNKIFFQHQQQQHHQYSLPSSSMRLHLMKWNNNNNNDEKKKKKTTTSKEKEKIINNTNNKKANKSQRNNKNNDNDNDDDNNNSNNKFLTVFMNQINPSINKKESISSSSIQQQSSSSSSFSLQLSQLFNKVISFIPPTFKINVLSFLFGFSLSITLLLLIPIFFTINVDEDDESIMLMEPITLFDTILTDINRQYVDPVNPTKLFETGISAMLQSLDPYTEFEGKKEAMELSESVNGKYGGVGLVISGSYSNPSSSSSSSVRSQSSSQSSSSSIGNIDVGDVDGGDATKSINSDSMKEGEKGDDDNDESILSPQQQQQQQQQKKNIPSKSLNNNNNNNKQSPSSQQQTPSSSSPSQGIRVVSAFEGYAFDYGMRVGDTILAIDNDPITDQTSVEDVRNKLRGLPGTDVSITFHREGVIDDISLVLPRNIIKIRDVRLATLLGDPKDGMGYIQLRGFASDAGLEVRNAILALQKATEDATNGKKTLQGLILDLRGNPGGLLTSAVDVSSLLVPKGSNIVSARGRGFPSITYRSNVDPILNLHQTKLAILINDQTASAAEIVSGAVQDLDLGIIVGTDRTFGKGLVQNVEDLPFNTALKFTVAKYYTPSGRCIQRTTYEEGGVGNNDGVDNRDGLKKSPRNGKYIAKVVDDKEKAIFYTKNGRQVRDGGGIEVDYPIIAPKASSLETTLLQFGVFSDYAAEWSKTHELPTTTTTTMKPTTTTALNFKVDDRTYHEFLTYVKKQQSNGQIQLDAIYNRPIKELSSSLKESGYLLSSMKLNQFRINLIHEIQNDFIQYKVDIKEDIEQNILARYLPESMLIERSIKTDNQVLEVMKLLYDTKQFNDLLARTNNDDVDNDDGVVDVVGNGVVDVVGNGVVGESLQG